MKIKSLNLNQKNAKMPTVHTPSLAITKQKGYAIKGKVHNQGRGLGKY
jgi:hypothetical protein